jgi:hypothetical protein
LVLIMCGAWVVRCSLAWVWDTPVGVMQDV